MIVRRVSADLKIKVPGNHTGLYAVPIQFDRRDMPPERQEKAARRSRISRRCSSSRQVCFPCHPEVGGTDMGAVGMLKGSAGHEA